MKGGLFRWLPTLFHGMMGDLLRPKREKFPVPERAPIPDVTVHGPSGTRRFYRRGGRRSWFQHRKHVNRIARLARRVARQRGG